MGGSAKRSRPVFISSRSHTHGAYPHCRLYQQNDIYGVLNVEEESFEKGVKIDPQKVKLLKMIVDETGADIILSSSWKRGYHRFVEDGYQTKDQSIQNQRFLSYQGYRTVHCGR